MSLKNWRESQGRGYFFPNGGLGNTKGYNRKKRSLTGPIIIACAIIAVLVAADYLMNSGRIYRGVEVGDVAIGGQTPTEARQISSSAPVARSSTI